MPDASKPESTAAPRDRLLDAVVELMLADGFEGVSVRRVATAAGVSIGAVQHHFPTKSAMLAAAMDRVSDQFTARLQCNAEGQQDPELLLRAVLTELLGAGEERRPGTVIWLQRLARAAVDEQAAAAHAKDWRDIEALIAELLRQCRPDSEPNWRQDMAADLLGLLDGLAAALVTEPDRMPRDRAERLLDRRLREVLGTGR
ncbi:TetR/AcrR family transcriptional regulator [Microlunatus soli]|uniref:DNA-binding transcriptional regulator, AcrR family n=1 Tax=Microlunatus soli TaxID=630515 RepID=A0A1H1YE00_9ACTN|nr:TetR/AcrR family transcriptional regulator [Microlunatus soli]SDT19611.1 DNA-binding transcriptional regulator, AcrR family [Microlunatus soli]